MYSLRITMVNGKEYYIELQDDASFQQAKLSKEKLADSINANKSFNYHYEFGGESYSFFSQHVVGIDVIKWSEHVPEFN